MKLPAYASWSERIAYYIYWAVCIAILIFLIAPILIILPLSFNQEPYFTFTPGMLALESEAYSTRWYQRIITFGMGAPDSEFGRAFLQDMWNNSTWIRSFRNSIFIALCSTLLATGLGTLAAVGLSRAHMPCKTLITNILISPMIVPLVITATGMYFFYADIGLNQTYSAIILSHTALGIPYVVITVTATLYGFDHSLVHAARSLGASGLTTFRHITMPLILPGMISGGLFAFVTSLDEVVVVLFLADAEQRTIPRQMWAGIREQISPTILAVATLLVLLSIVLLTAMELLRRRSERLRGLAP